MLRQSKGGWNINSQKIVLTNGGGIAILTYHTKGIKKPLYGVIKSKSNIIKLRDIRAIIIKRLSQKNG